MSFARIVAMDRVEALACFFGALLFFLPSFAPIAIAMAVTPEDLDSGRVHVGAPCALRARGLTCATCGMTRGFAALAHGRPGDARRYNANAPIAFGACAAIAAVSLLVMVGVGMQRIAAASGTKAAPSSHGIHTDAPRP